VHQVYYVVAQTKFRQDIGVENAVLRGQVRNDAIRSSQEERYISQTLACISSQTHPEAISQLDN